METIRYHIKTSQNKEKKVKKKYPNSKIRVFLFKYNLYICDNK